MKLRAKEDFAWSHQGIRVEYFKKGQPIETDDADLIEVSLREGWTAKARETQSPVPPVADPATLLTPPAADAQDPAQPD